MNNKNRDEREQERRNTVKLNFSFDFLLIKDDKKTSTFLSIQLGLFLLCFGYSNQVSSKVYVCKLSVEEQQQQPRASMNNSDEFHYTTKIDNQISWRWCWLRDHVRFYFRLARKFKTFYQNKTKNHKKMWLCVCVWHQLRLPLSTSQISLSGSVCVRYSLALHDIMAEYDSVYHQFCHLNHFMLYIFYELFSFYLLICVWNVYSSKRVNGFWIGLKVFRCLTGAILANVR